MARSAVNRDGSSDPVLDFLQLLWAIEHGLERRSKRMARTLGVTGPQRLVLRIVERRPGITPGALADVIHLHPSTLTGVLRRLEKKRLLQRDQDPDDHRRAQLHVRPAARPVTRATDGTIEAVVAQALDRAPARALRHTCEVLEVVARGLGDGVDGAGSRRR